jgi:hypothetical protein
MQAPDRGLMPGVTPELDPTWYLDTCPRTGREATPGLAGPPAPTSRRSPSPSRLSPSTVAVGSRGAWADPGQGSHVNSALTAALCGPRGTGKVSRTTESHVPWCSRQETEVANVNL